MLRQTHAGTTNPPRAAHAAPSRTAAALRLFEALPDPVIVADANARIVDLNPAAERFFGYRSSELATTPILALLCNAGADRADIEPALERDDKWEGELQVRTRHQGLRTLNTTLLRVPGQEGSGALTTLAICHDMTDRQDAQNTQRGNEFVAMLSHELRNPLAPIISSLALMRHIGISDPRIASSHAIVERQVGHLCQLVDDLLDVSRYQHGKIVLTTTALPLQTLIADAIDVSLPAIGAAGHQLDLREIPVLTVQGDLTRLVQALSNVLNNAAKFTPAGGTITIDCFRTGGCVCIRVSDNGQGISTAFQLRLFDLFTQADDTLARTGSGLGVGLTITQQIMALHGGSIAVHSGGIGAGSCFTLRLPCADAPPGRTTKETTMASSTAPRQGFRILLIDDNEDANESMAALLELMEYDVRTASNSAGALALAAQFEPQLILSDIGLPGMNGYQLAPALREITGQRKVILVAATGYGNANDKQRSQMAGFDHHLVKPLDADMLLEFVATQAAAY
ncbi:ATP-binding protein [Actimicrobium sp. CCC2.4]|uniref:hybrid sensor histidine kinase/response regulator n=1 Tax=Actimicrobium sp. CCC2.4 TaxID=3048606 RepID=UPI002AC8F48C|nr:ATP-binding protein [Actimicrobium sp. CCC2.4]MEB0134148.1 ATP-binding protein [Actimicrobium sp. CCC2.4]WPX32803.1 ATP-binding protein [Actimicrobium sp. CCC2.4]